MRLSAAQLSALHLAFYWSHMWRNFYELATPGPAPIASEALQHIAEFYAIEKDIRIAGSISCSRGPIAGKTLKPWSEDNA